MTRTDWKRLTKAQLSALSNINCQGGGSPYTAAGRLALTEGKNDE